MAQSRKEKRQGIRYKIRKTINGTSETPRLAVFRSNKQIYAQLIDDTAGSTIVAASSTDKSIADKKVNKIEQAKLVGSLIGEKAKAAGVESVRFDRGGFLEILKKYLDNAQIASDWEVLKKASEEVLVNSLSMLCPFEPEEKQVLLEAETIVKRLDVLVTLMKLSSENDVESRYVQ